MSRNRYTKRSLYILTEGETEEAYFSRIGEILGDDKECKYSVKVDVREIEDGCKTDPVNMVKEAKESKTDYDEIWVVFDRDRERDDQNIKAIELAKKWKIGIAFSSIAFEEWVLLHFEKCTKAFERSDCGSRGGICTCNGSVCVKSYIKQNYYPAFEKGRTKLYDDLNQKQNIALDNAAWLKHQYAQITNYHLLNPYTDVDTLVSKLLELPAIRYERINSVFSFDEIDFFITHHSTANHIISVSIQVTNNSTNPLIFNNAQENIKLLDINNQELVYTVSQTKIIYPAENKEVVLQFHINEHQISKLKFCSIKEWIYVELL